MIETQTVVPSKRLIETNHLIIHENETRNVGTIVHKNTIIEKEQIFTKRNVDHKTINTEVNLVENKYENERKHVVEERELPGTERNLPNCDCDYKRRSRGSGLRHGSPVRELPLMSRAVHSRGSYDDNHGPRYR